MYLQFLVDWRGPDPRAVRHRFPRPLLVDNRVSLFNVKTNPKTPQQTEGRRVKWSLSRKL